MSRELAGLTNRGGGDSENEGQEVTPDTDTDSQAELLLHKHSSTNSSFKRATPIMGTRGLETRNSKRSHPHNTNGGGVGGGGGGLIQSVPPPCGAALLANAAPLPKKEYGHQHNVIMGPPPIGQPPPMPATSVGALEVQNVKRAINRYGTLPKNARIGAYLESLRQNSEGGPPLNAALSLETPTAVPLPPAVAALIIQPQLLPQPTPNNILGSRNAAAQLKAAATASGGAQPQMIRSNSSGGVTMTNSATASVNKLQRHRTTTDGTLITFSSFRGATNSPKRGVRPSLADFEFPPPPADLPPPPEEFETTPGGGDVADVIPVRAVEQSQMVATIVVPPPTSDVENTEPSVEEASTRFGVSLRKREPSSDSCSSMGSPDNTLDSQKSERVGRDHRDDQQTRTTTVQQKTEKGPDPVSQLVNELAERRNLNKPHASPELVYKSADGLRKTASSTNLPPKPNVGDQNQTNTNTLKAQLKKVEPKRVVQTPKQDEQPAIIDFKSRLRKVDSSPEHPPDDAAASLENTKNNNEPSNGCKSSESDADIAEDKSNRNEVGVKKATFTGKSEKTLAKTEIKIDIRDEEKGGVDGTTAVVATSEEDKRKSTGSISSLKKLWEAKETSPGTDQTPVVVQLSPKMPVKNVTKADDDPSQPPPPPPPLIEEQQPIAKKPAVPVKPTKLTIYATPIQQKSPTNNENAATTTSTTATNRETILELVNLIEDSFKTPVSTISASQWLQLSDKLNILQNSCVVFADKETMQPHLKFHFRELVGRVETQSRSLRSAGSKNIQDNEKLVTEVGQSLKQISNALHR